MPRTARTFLCTALCTVGWAAGCGNNEPLPKPLPASIVVTPTGVSIAVGATTQLTATAYDSTGVALATQPIFTWSSSAASIASVGSSGLVAGVSAGSAIITASSLAVASAGDAVTVAPPPATIAVAASRTSVLAGDPSVAITATVANSTATIGWTLSGPGALSANTGASIGWTPPPTLNAAATAVITAQLGTTTTTASVSIAVSPSTIAAITVSPGVLCEGTSGSGQLAASAVDASGDVLSPTFFWSSSNTAVATVDQTGLITVTGAGLADIVASAGGVSSGPVPVSALPPPSGILTYSAYDLDAGTYRLHMANIDGTGSDTSVAEGYGPRLSPDKTVLAYRRGGTAPSGTGDSIFVWDLNLASESLLVTNTDYIVGQSWTNDSETLIFDQSCAIYSIERDGGGGADFIPSSSCYSDNPDVSPADGRVAYQNIQYPNFINVADSSGANSAAIPNTNNDLDPRFSPDGKWLALDFTDGGPASGRLDKIALDGGSATSLTTFAVDADNFVVNTGPWTLDGNWVVVPVSRGTDAGAVFSIQAVAANGSGCMRAVPVEFASTVETVGSISTP